MDRLAELQTLVAVVDGGSLAEAARRMHRSAPAVTRALADLERRAGVSLVERSTRSCRPTPAGRRLADQARNLLGGYEEAMREPAGEVVAPRGLVRITAPSIFGRDYVAPLVMSFLDLYPEIAVDLELADRVVDLTEEEFDLGVRIGELANSGLVARSVGTVRQLVVASPAYLMLRGTPQRPEDVASHTVLQHAREGLNAPWTFRSEDNRSITVAVSARLGVNQPDTAISAALDGRGLVRVLSHQVDTDLREMRLVRVLRPFEPVPLPVSLVWPPSRRLWRRMRLLIDHLVEGLSRLDVLRRD